jgi:hypothetical protein
MAATYGHWERTFSVETRYYITRPILRQLPPWSGDTQQQKLSKRNENGSDNILHGKTKNSGCAGTGFKYTRQIHQIKKFINSD